MMLFHHFRKTKNNSTTHMQKLLNEIKIYLNNTTTSLNNFNTSLNKFLATDNVSNLRPDQTANHLSNSFQITNESSHVLHSHLFLLNNTISPHFFAFVLPFKNSTFRILLIKRNRYSITNNHPNAHNKPTFKQHKRQAVYKRHRHTSQLYGKCRVYMQYVNPTIILCSLFSKKHPNTTRYFSLPGRTLSTMPPSPCNLPSLAKETSPPVKLQEMNFKSPVRSSMKHSSLGTSSSRKKSSLKIKSSKSPKHSASPRKLVLASPSSVPIASPEKKPILLSKLPEPSANTEPSVTPNTSPVAEEYVPVQPPPTINFQEALTSLPSYIVHSYDTMYILCQLRRGKDHELNNRLASMHNDGSIKTFLPTMITAAFQPHPAPASISGNLVMREVKYVSIHNHNPTYSIAFSAVFRRTKEKALIYARHGTTIYNTMQAYVHDFIFEKWHTELAPALEVPEALLSAISFTIPPCNFPKSKPIAFLSGLPPHVYGRKFFHTQLLLEHLHTLIKPLLPGDAPIQHYPYFTQAFGIQVRRSYKFTEKESEELYVACISNIRDFEMISNIIFPTPSNPMPLLPIFNVPVSFIPIPVRPPSRGSALLTRHYKTLAAILTSIRKKKAIFSALPFITTHIIKDPASSKTRTMLLNHKQVTTYSILHSMQKGINTRIYISNKDKVGSNAEDTVRSWFPPSDHTYLFFPRTSRSATFNTTVPSHNLLQTVVQNLDSSLAMFAEALKAPPDASSKLMHPTPTATTPSDTNQSTKHPPQIPNLPSHETTTTQIPPPAYVSPQTSAPTHHNGIPQIPVFDVPSQLTPAKRSLHERSPSPSTSTSTSSITEITSDVETQADNKQNTSIKTSSSDDEELTHSIHIDGIISTLRNSIPSDKHFLMEDEDISAKACTVYAASNHQDALHHAKQQLLLLANQRFDEFARYKAREKKKREKSALKKKRSKQNNPYFA